jgi:hypothetical protein
LGPLGLDSVRGLLYHPWRREGGAVKKSGPVGIVMNPEWDMMDDGEWMDGGCGGEGDSMPLD